MWVQSSAVKPEDQCEKHPVREYSFVVSAKWQGLFQMAEEKKGKNKAKSAFQILTILAPVFDFYTINETMESVHSFYHILEFERVVPLGGAIECFYAPKNILFMCAQYWVKNSVYSMDVFWGVDNP